MLQIVDKNDIAERKPYRYSAKVSARIRKEKKAKEMKRKNMAYNVTKIDSLTETVGDIDNIPRGNILNKILEN